MTTPAEQKIVDDERLVNAIFQLVIQAKGLRMELELWRKHSGSQGHFLQLAMEKLTKAVSELQEALNTPTAAPATK